MDNETIKRELEQDHLLSETQLAKLEVLLSPTTVKKTIQVQRRLQKLKNILPSKPKVFWAGRFDRQKNFRLLTEIARRTPQVEYWVWGKAVLNDTNIESHPKNIVFKGVYGDFSELPLDQCTAWLYTSLWDGLPTILIDVAATGTPIIASNVGGIPTLLEGFGGSLVDSYANADAYISRIQELLQNIEAFRENANTLANLVESKYSIENYNESIKIALDT
ncbi:hypothetical protein MNKW57_26430 [Biformimicrobium ophioploci]|uniref:Glycosyltransferase n=1 Tax=Biformimicrobium ophioploci TaxID=3036711 RepID=A0ABQ6M1X0_9GAMM|nr:hypothetical protein MNKW57_26430 [Microbulbifer sp. NKW57]